MKKDSAADDFQLSRKQFKVQNRTVEAKSLAVSMSGEIPFERGDLHIFSARHFDFGLSRLSAFDEVGDQREHP